jgi:hypothetical protein
MDRTARLIGEVAARYGIRLDADDPAFALVALNQLALEDTIEQLAARMNDMAAQLERSAESVGLRAGIAVAEQIRNATAMSPGQEASGRGRTDPDYQARADATSHPAALWFAVGCWERRSTIWAWPGCGRVRALR